MNDNACIPHASLLQARGSSRKSNRKLGGGGDSNDDDDGDDDDDERESGSLSPGLSSTKRMSAAQLLPYVVDAAIRYTHPDVLKVNATW